MGSRFRTTRSGRNSPCGGKRPDGVGNCGSNSPTSAAATQRPGTRARRPGNRPVTFESIDANSPPLYRNVSAMPPDLTVSRRRLPHQRHCPRPGERTAAARCAAGAKVGRRATGGSYATECRPLNAPGLGDPPPQGGVMPSQTCAWAALGGQPYRLARGTGASIGGSAPAGSKGTREYLTGGSGHDILLLVNSLVLAEIGDPP